MMDLIDSNDGAFRFLRGIAPYSSGVVASPGHEIVWVTFRRPLALEKGLRRAAELAQVDGVSRESLCAVALRSPTTMDLDAFANFNLRYREILADLHLLRDDPNPIARTNVTPSLGIPSEPVLHSFGYARRLPGARPWRPTFVVAGAAELRDQALNTDAIIRPGDTSPGGMAVKADHVMAEMTIRMRGLDCSWDQVTVVNVYTTQDVRALLDQILRPLGDGAVHGLRWYPSTPPVNGLDFEMDVRGVMNER